MAGKPVGTEGSYMAWGHLNGRVGGAYLVQHYMQGPRVFACYRRSGVNAVWFATSSVPGGMWSPGTQKLDSSASQPGS